MHLAVLLNLILNCVFKLLTSIQRYMESVRMREVGVIVFHLMSLNVLCFKGSDVISWRRRKSMLNKIQLLQSAEIMRRGLVIQGRNMELRSTVAVTGYTGSINSLGFKEVPISMLIQTGLVLGTMNINEDL